MSSHQQRSFEFGRYRLIPAERLLLLDGEPVPLTPKAFDTLVALVRRAGRLIEKNELLGEVWPGTIVEESNIAQNVFALRRALGRSDDGAEYIETVPKRGYRFLLPVTEVEEGVEALQTAAADSPAEEQYPTPRDGTLPAVTVAPEGVSAPASPRRRVASIAAGAVLLLLGAAFLTTLALRSPVPASSPALEMSRLMSGTRIPSAALSPDGRYVGHVVENGDEATVFIRQVSTLTDLLVVPPDREAWYWGLAFSRDGDSLYYVKHIPGGGTNVLYRVSALGGTPRKILQGIDSNIGLSPDGKQLTFVREATGAESQLVVANADGTNERVLATRRWPGSFFSSSNRGGPSWSPDGTLIATGIITTEGGYHGEVITVPAVGGTESRLASAGWYQVGQVAWLPDGSGLLVTARETSAAQIWHVAYPGGSARRLLTDLADYHNISMTADAKLIAAVQYDRRSTISFLPPRPASVPRRNTEGMDEGFYGMAWTPAGELVYVSEASGNNDLWLATADGRRTRQLTTDPEHEGTPAVSPDGRSVVFISRRGDGNPHVWRMDIDGSNPLRLTSQASEGTPSFTPDGRWVVYAVAGAGVWKVPAAGGSPVRVAAGYLHTPSLSPDGSVAVCFYGDAKRVAPDQLALVPIAGNAPMKLLPMPDGLSGSTIRWTPDGRSLIYAGSRQGVANLWTLPLDGSVSQQLTSFSSDQIFNFAHSRDHQQLAVSRGTTAEHVVLIRNAW